MVTNKNKHGSKNKTNITRQTPEKKRNQRRANPKEKENITCTTEESEIIRQEGDVLHYYADVFKGSQFILQNNLYSQQAHDVRATSYGR